MKQQLFDMVNCLACDKELKMEPLHGREATDCIGVVYDGLVCRTSGNYGSEIFDSQNSEYLEFYVCDKCAKARVDKFKHVTYIKHAVSKPVKSVPWNGN